MIKSPVGRSPSPVRTPSTHSSQPTSSTSHASTPHVSTPATTHAPVQPGTSSQSGFKSPPTSPRPHSPELSGSPSAPSSALNASHTAEHAGNMFMSQAQKQKQPHPLEQHIGKKHEEQQALQHWNVNGEGRNQGLVHLVDYSHARPTKAEAEKATAHFTPEQHAAFGKGKHELWSGKKWNEQIGEQNFNKMKGKYFTEAPGTGNSPKLQHLQGQVDATQGRLNTASQELNGRRQEYKASIASLPKKEQGQAMKTWEANNGGEVAALKQQLGQQKTELDGARTYTPVTDESKKGRLQQIEQATGLAPGSLKGNEIVGGTNAVQGHLNTAAQGGHGMPVNVRPPSRPMEMMQPQGTLPNGRTHWEQQQVPVEKLSHTADGKLDHGGLNVVKWGVATDPSKTTAEDLKLSTVMGSSTK